MKCNHCGKNEATSRFVVSYMGNTGEVYLCEECLSGFQRYASGVMGGFAPDAMMSGPFAETSLREGFAPSKESARVLVREAGESDFPTDAGEDLRRRRRLSELGARLKAAVEQEDYETAAMLRDELFREERERDVHAT